MSDTEDKITVEDLDKKQTDTGGQEHDLDISSPVEDDEQMTDREIDEMLGVENTDDAGVGQGINAGEDYDPNWDLPENSAIEYVRDPKTGMWKARKKKNRKPDDKKKQKQSAPNEKREQPAPDEEYQNSADEYEQTEDIYEEDTPADRDAVRSALSRETKQSEPDYEATERVKIDDSWANPNAEHRWAAEFGSDSFKNPSEREESENKSEYVHNEEDYETHHQNSDLVHAKEAGSDDDIARQADVFDHGVFDDRSESHPYDTSEEAHEGNEKRSGILHEIDHGADEGYKDRNAGYEEGRAGYEAEHGGYDEHASGYERYDGSGRETDHSPASGYETDHDSAYRRNESGSGYDTRNHDDEHEARNENSSVSHAKEAGSDDDIARQADVFEKKSHGLFSKEQEAQGDKQIAFESAREIEPGMLTSDNAEYASILASAVRIDNRGVLYDDAQNIVGSVDKGGQIHLREDLAYQDEPERMSDEYDHRTAPETAGSYSESTEWMTGAADNGGLDVQTGEVFRNEAQKEQDDAWNGSLSGEITDEEKRRGMPLDEDGNPIQSEKQPEDMHAEDYFDASKFDEHGQRVYQQTVESFSGSDIHNGTYGGEDEFGNDENGPAPDHENASAGSDENGGYGNENQNGPENGGRDNGSSQSEAGNENQDTSSQNGSGNENQSSSESSQSGSGNGQNENGSNQSENGNGNQSGKAEGGTASDDKLNGRTIDGLQALRRQAFAGVSEGDERGARKAGLAFVDAAIAKYGSDIVLDERYINAAKLNDLDMEGLAKESSAAYVARNRDKIDKDVHDAIARAENVFEKSAAERVKAAAQQIVNNAAAQGKTMSMDDAVKSIKTSRSYVESKHSFIADDVTRTLTDKYGHRVVYLQETLNQNGIKFEKDAYKDQIEHNKKGSSTKVNRNDVQVEKSKQHAHFGNWSERIYQNGVSTIRAVLMKLHSYNPYAHPQTREAAAQEELLKGTAQNVLAIAGGIGAMKIRQDIDLAETYAASGWAKVLSVAKVDENGNIVFGKDKKGVGFNGRFQSITVMVKTKDGDMVRKTFSPLDILTKDFDKMGDTGLNKNQTAAMLRRFAKSSQSMITTQQTVSAIANAAPGLFTKDELKYLRGGKAKNFFGNKSPRMTDAILRKALSKINDQEGYSKLLASVYNSKDLLKIIKKMRKEAVPNDTLIAIAEHRMKALQKVERGLKMRQSAKGLLRTITSTVMTAGLSTEAQGGIREIRRYKRMSTRMFILSKAGFQGVVAINHFAHTTRLARFLQHHIAVFRLIGGIDGKLYIFFKRGGILDSVPGRAKNAAIGGAKGAVKLAGKGVGKAAGAAIKGVRNSRLAASASEAMRLKKAAFRAKHASLAKKADAFYNGTKKAASGIKKGAKAANNAKKSVKSGIGRFFRPISEANSKAKLVLAKILKWVLIIGLILSAVWIIVVILFNMVFVSGAGLAQISANNMDQTPEMADESVNYVYSKLSAQLDKAKAVITGDPSNTGHGSVASDIDGNAKTIEHFGHPANSSAKNSQTASQGYSEGDYDSIIYITKDEENEIKDYSNKSGSVDKYDLDQLNAAIKLDPTRSYQGTSNSAEVMAIAAAMFENNIQGSFEQYKALLSDLNDIMNPDRSYTVVSDTYANQNSGTESFTYYCNNKDGGRQGDADKDYQSYVSSLTAEGGALYDTNGMIVGTYYGDKTAGEAVDTITWHTDEEERGCEFDQDAYDADYKKWQDSYPERDDYYSKEGFFDESAYNQAVQDWNDSEPDKKDYYYCPGHEVTIDYGNRDASVYIVRYSADNIEGDADFISKIESSPNYDQYKDQIATFVQSGGFQSTDASTADTYKTLVKNYVKNDWQEAYGITLEYYEDALLTLNSSSGNYTDPALGLDHPATSDTTAALSSLVSTSTSASREAIVDDAASFVGRISYYYGGRASSPDFSKNGFGRTIAPDHVGRTVKGLDCSGFVDFVFWQEGIHPIDRGMGTAGYGYLPEFYNPSELRPGDLGLHHSSKSSTQGTGNHVGIFMGYDANGNQLWCACGSRGVRLYTSGTRTTVGEFKCFYDTSALLDK